MYFSPTTNYPEIRTNYSVSLISEQEGKDLSSDLKVAVKHSDLAIEIQLGTSAYYALEEVQNNLKKQVILVLILIM
jgi:hypothetical protein